MNTWNSVRLWFSSSKNKLLENINYCDLDGYIEQDFLTSDIVKFLEDIDKINSVNFYEVALDKTIVPHRKIVSVTFRKWCCDNGKLTSDLTLLLNTLLTKSTKLEKEYNKLLKVKNGGTVASFNIRKIKPYIINIDNIRKLLNIN